MSAEERHEQIRALAGAAHESNLGMAPLLAAAHTDHDYEELGMETYAQYLESLGVSKSQDSKLRKAYGVFGERWWLAMRTADATLERLYLGARLSERDGMVLDDAYALVCSTPSSELVALLKGEPADPKPVHECPECGAEHVRKDAA